MYSLPLLQEPAVKISSECIHFDLKTDCDSEKSLLSICLGLRYVKLKFMRVTSPFGSGQIRSRKTKSGDRKFFNSPAGKLVIFLPLFTGEYSLLWTNHCLFSIILAIIITLLFISIWLALDFVSKLLFATRFMHQKFMTQCFINLLGWRCFFCTFWILLYVVWNNLFYRKRKDRKKKLSIITE